MTSDQDKRKVGGEDKVAGSTKPAREYLLIESPSDGTDDEALEQPRLSCKEIQSTTGGKGHADGKVFSNNVSGSKHKRTEKEFTATMEPPRETQR